MVPTPTAVSTHHQSSTRTYSLSSNFRNGNRHNGANIDGCLNLLSQLTTVCLHRPRSQPTASHPTTPATNHPTFLNGKRHNECQLQLLFQPATDQPTFPICSQHNGANTDCCFNPQPVINPSDLQPNNYCLNPPQVIKPFCLVTLQLASDQHPGLEQPA